MSEISDAVQIIRVGYDTIEIAMKVGSGSIEMMQKAVNLLIGLLEHEKTMGKTNLKGLLEKGGDIQVLTFADEDLKKFQKLAKKYGILYSVMPDADRKDGITEVLFHSEAAPRLRMICQKLKNGRMFDMDEYLKNGNEEQLNQLLDFLEKEKKGKKSLHTDVTEPILDGLIEKVGHYAMEKKAIRVEDIQNDFQMESKQAEDVLHKLKTIGVVSEPDGQGNYPVVMDQESFEKRINRYRELSNRMRQIAAAKNTALTDITITKQLIAAENDHAVKTRVPGMYGSNVGYIWIRKEDIMEIHNGKTLLTYLDKEKDYKIYSEDNRVLWAANFGEQTTALELTVEGSGFRFKTRFNKFTNLPELMNLFKEVADIQTRDMLDLDVPALRGAKYIIVESEPDWYVKQVMEEFVTRAERIRNGGVDPSEDNFLKITHEARLLGTDARLLMPDAPNNVDGKLNKVVENVLYEYQKAEQEGIIGTQLIFSDIGTPKSGWKEEMLTVSWAEADTFDVYNYLKTELVKQGIPADQIAFIHDAKTDAARDALFREMRSGTKRILIGSTDKCGTGVNVQTHLTAMHHVDCPWKPSSIEQREGRGLRQGNENSEVAVYRYVTKGTFDAYSWSLVENKQRFISQVMTSKSISRSCEDIDEATLSYAEIKAVATGNPLIKEKMEVDNEVQRLKMLKASYDSQHYSLQDQFMIKFPKLIAAANEKLNCVHADIKKRDEQVLAADEEFAIKVGNMTFHERVDGGTAVLAAVSKCKVGETTGIGEYRGFEVQMEKNFIGVNYLILHGRTDYKVELSNSPVGCMVKLENCFNGMDGNIEFLEKKLEQYQRDMEQAKAEYEKPFAYEEELKSKTARQFEFNTQLDLENKPITEENGQEISQVAENAYPYGERKDYR